MYRIRSCEQSTNGDFPACEYSWDEVLTMTLTKNWPCYEMDKCVSGLDMIFWYELNNRQGHEVWYMNIRSLYRSRSLIQLQL
jgi:hypothetical protein